MLCYNGLGEETQAEEHKARYLRFKADEAAQAITGPYRELHPEDNNERQAIHEHYGVSLAAAPPQKSAVKVLTRRGSSGPAAKASASATGKQNHRPSNADSASPQTYDRELREE
jgi:hypothetical protein